MWADRWLRAGWHRRAQRAACLHSVLPLTVQAFTANLQLHSVLCEQSPSSRAAACFNWLSSRVNICDVGYCAVFVQSKLESQQPPRRVVFIGALPEGASEGDVIQLGLPFGRMTNLVFAKKKCQVWWALIHPFMNTYAVTALYCFAVCYCHVRAVNGTW